MIDLSSLQKTLTLLKEGLAARAATPQDEFIRDACLQRLKYCYEASHRTLRQYLRETEPFNIDELSFPALVRLGFKRGLLARSWDVWDKFKIARINANGASDTAEAEAALDILSDFYAEATFLFSKIARQQGHA